jgi:hypothetical protein
MKDSLKEKISDQGRLADELVNTQGYELISKKMTQRAEGLLQEALNAETIGELKYAKGFIDGVSYFRAEIETMISRRETLKKKH